MNYYLAEACGNTFVLFDCIEKDTVDSNLLKQIHGCLVAENRDDALILLGGEMEGKKLQANMLVLGLDGALGEFCGNGSRAVACYLYKTYDQFTSFFLKTPWGTHPLIKENETIFSIKLPQPSFKYNSKFISDPSKIPKGFHYVEMLEPHLIVQKPLSDEELLSIGRKLNLQKEIFPLGINVNAWQILDHNTLLVKTYERGVQRLTQSCGSGSICCAAFYQGKDVIDILTPGGSLNVLFQKDGVQLKGAACVSYKERKGK
jgi:diaminopimelate epimerase